MGRFKQGKLSARVTETILEVMIRRRYGSDSAGVERGLLSCTVRMRSLARAGEWVVILGLAEVA